MNRYFGSLLLLCTSVSLAADSPRTVYHVEAVAGSANLGDGGPAISAQIGSIEGIAVDRWGNLYLSDTDHHRVRKIAASGLISTIAGTGTAGFSGDGGPGWQAQLNLPYGLAVDLAGYVYVADLGNNRVRRIAPDGTIITVAGSGAKGSSGDGGLAIDAQLLTPRNVAVDVAGNLYISEFEGHRVRHVSSDGRINTTAGTGTAGFRGDGSAAASSQLGYPAGLAVDRFGALYVADTQNNRIRRIVPGGVISTVLGGSPGTAMETPVAVTVDISGTIYVADNSYIVRAYTAAGAWTDFAGTRAQGYSGDGGPASKASLTRPRDLAADLNGNLFIADDVRIRRVDSRAQISTLAGDGYLHVVGDGGPATAAELFQPSAAALDSSGTLYIADTGTARVRQVQAAGNIATLAGNGVAASGADGIWAAATSLNHPMGITVDPFGNILIADTYNHRIRQVTGGLISTIVGTGTPGVGQDGLEPLKTQLRGPHGTCTDRAGHIFIVDTSNHRVLRINPASVVLTLAGNGAPGDAGDGGQARLAQLNQPSACALDSAGNLFIADTLSHRIRQVTPAGIISTVAGTGDAAFSGDEAAATAARINAPRGVAVDDGGDIFIADTGNHRIRQVTPDGVIHTIAGQGTAGWAGDGDSATQALLNSPQGLYLDGAGDLYFADTGNNRIRRLVPDSIIAPQPIVLPPAISAVNSASLRQGAVAPGELLTIYGTGLGPDTGVSGAPDASGLLANQLAGAEVRFDGVAAPISYAQSTQLNVQVPYTVAGVNVTHIAVFYQGQPAGTLDVPVAAANPALFPTAVNQDGSVNSGASPAPRATIVTFFATGEGLTDGANVAGKAAQAPYPRPRLPVSLTVSGISAEIVFAGSAPGTVGTLQVNARIPAGFVPSGPVPVELDIGSATSPPLIIWVK
jgi:uncharacterized protein (TIGR03437 family)